MLSDTELNVVVMGLGYIGLPTAAIIARTGARVLGVDVTERVVETINSGRVHIEEVDLDGLVSGVVARGTLRAAMTVEPADVFVIAVPTPFDAAHAPDISYVLGAATTIAPVLKPGDTVILESTSPVGTTEKVRDLLATLRPDLRVPGRTRDQADIAIAYCPERVLPGRILVELIDNDRVIGGITPRCARKALTFYRRFVRGACVTTTARAAEMTKLTENAFRDVNIAFANELSLIADTMNVDVWEVIRLANRHPRVNILQPGPGVGGHCIAVDPWFLVHAAPDQTPLIRTAREVNDGKTDHVIAQVAAMIAADPTAPVACLGLAFKANIDDFRESPAMKVALAVANRFGDRVRIVEPYAAALPPAFDGTGATLIDVDTAIETCPIMVVLVDHDVFRSIPLEERSEKTVLDTRGIWPDQPRSPAQPAARLAG
ncbi:MULTISPECIES: UDP-N-acetyl-D-mannosamine dehydrogenase [unclassified Sphingomonas]|jgi:UDP-N-acetyl-D-mannosaminuronic acid dehydrogenase|uniref:UDP-N-acetyl-D-mannosamine dehydrogenase n=1 Tax=unclassified Sphingomonas TaxID=196159 RepID=UPI0005382205|nr:MULTISPECIES: UDP-N-acetyl-D-mannosamine dehydrogenase [unclassified Sphingomonas]KHA63530.1 UDP-N-acetyl-D-mannosaminuronic acid dehydrogenase [Sphingomonas sp. Ant20]KQN22546.1 UDP-N-acetyl-D-mannosaminuronic acid dehydrogenase [Sphingomonas sp. Leaf30]MBD8470281.1 UDP-N-acetyl-D-mannosamine dehydrogenase [Sphingomonas sp. CFBP 8765]MBD8549111.1 UDP-N-acetyl-D-mannosamine dehydrogenase [Sphingomonas sp. CFBP 8764]